MAKMMLTGQKPPVESSTDSRGDDTVSVADSMIKIDAFGQDATVKHLFKRHKDVIWKDVKPNDETLQITNDEKYAIVVKRQANADETRVELTSITVQSPHLKEILGRVFEGYMGISTQLRKVEFERPFHAFCLKWEEYQEAVDELQDPVAIQHAQLLHPIIFKEIEADLDRIHDLTSHGLISFDYLWAIFEPDRDVYAKVNGQHRLHKISKVDKTSEGAFNIHWKLIDTDGTSFGFVTDKFMITYFDGVKKITDLPYIPADHYPGIEDIKSRLTQRGAKFRDLKGIHHVSYAGSYLPAGTKQRHTLNYGRVMIDSESCCANGAKMSIPKLTETQDFLDDAELMYCTTFVRGYCLTTRQWAKFDIDNISPVTWAEDAFERLILSSDWKEILLSFVASQLSNTASSDSFDDVIKGKGKGMIMLLAGTPGVGKTLTAESIAEKMQLPLYCIGISQLGTSPSSVEKNLNTHMELSTRWGATMLLDEADVFLAARNPDNLERSRLVSVFLRTLEYFRGTMFLTTNRADTLDPAFESRIHLVFNYPSLDFGARRRIWTNFVDKPSAAGSKGATAPPYESSLTDADVDALAALDVNGRVIKNIVKTASLLAARKERPISMDDVQTVLRVKGMSL